MYEEQQATMPSFTSNPNPPHADASMYQYSQGLDGLEPQPAFELDGAAASQSGTISQIADSTTSEQAAGNSSDVSGHVANNTTSQQPEPVQCEVCNITCNSKEVFEVHTHGKKHMKNMQKIAISSVIGPKVTPPTATATATATSVGVGGELETKKHMLLQNGASADTLRYCETCNVVCNNQDGFQAHLAGKKHSSKANMQGTGTNDVFTPATSNQMNLRCELCKISCTSFELLNAHLIGKKHLKKLKESDHIPDPECTEEGKLVNSHPWSCEICGISCNTYEVLQKHLSGKKHQKNLEKSENPIGPNPNPNPNPNPCTQPQEEDEEGKVVNNNKKTKRVGMGSDEDLEAKRQKILQGGAAVDALRTCTVCNVVCSSPSVYISHLAGKKHAAMAVKEAENGLTGQQT